MIKKILIKDYVTKNRGDNLSLNFKFYDVNLGNCTLIQTEKLNILFDIGTNEITGKNPLFSFNGQLDLLIITHPHKDHISGLIDIENKITTK